MATLFLLLRPSTLLYYLRQFLLVRKNEGRVYIARWRLSFDNTTRVTTEKEGKIAFGFIAHLQSNCTLETFGSAEITIGPGFFANKNCSIVARSSITIGAHCLFGPNVCVYDHDHGFGIQGINFRNQGFVTKPVIIGSNVWLGANVFVAKGVTIGDNVVVGAGTVVTQSIPANSVFFTRRENVLKPLPAHPFANG